MPAEIDYKRSRGRPRSTTKGKPGQTVQALDRALALLKVLSEMDQANLTEIGLRSGNPPSTAHRLLTTMQWHGIVEFDDGSQNWTIGVEAFRIGSSFLRKTKVADAGRPLMHELMVATGETANMACADDGDVVFISQVETHQAIRAFFRPGTRGPMHASGIGKALLAELPPDAVEQILQRKGLPTYTAKTLTSPTILFAELEATRRRGWAIDDEERNVGMRCVAAPIFNPFGEAVAGISISGPTARITDDQLSAFGPLVKQAAASVTAAIGGKQPSRSTGSL